MTKHGITKSGGEYWVGGIHYPNLADAIAYLRSLEAENELSKKYGIDNYEEIVKNEQQKQLMQKHGITKDGDNYSVGGKFYAKLPDAVAYARRLESKK